MKQSNLLILIALTGLLFSACKKELNNTTQLELEEEIAAKYGLKKVELKKGEKITKQFSSPQEMETYFENRFKNINRKQFSKKPTVNSDDFNIIESYSSNSSGGSYNAPALFMFPEFAFYNFPDRFQCELWQNGTSWFWFSGPTVGNYTYAPGSASIESLGFKYYGLYTENYGGGIFTYTKSWNLSVNVQPSGTSYRAIAVMTDR
jgi:hypothetical protein